MLNNVGPLTERPTTHTIQGMRGGPGAALTLSRPRPGLPYRSIFPSQALFYRLGLNRRPWTAAFTQRSATHAGSFTVQSAPLHHLHLIILAFGSVAKGQDKQDREAVTQNSKTVSCWENLGISAAVWATSASLQTLTAAADSADRTRRARLQYLWLVGGVEDERPHVCTQPGGTALPAVLLGCSAVLLRQDCSDRTKYYCKHDRVCKANRNHHKMSSSAGEVR